MVDIQAGQNSNAFLLAGIAVLVCAIAHFIYKLLGRKNEEAIEHESEKDTDAHEKQETKPTAERPSNRKTKKLASWSSKHEFSHPWLLKNLKGHPGTVLHMDFSANGKFMAATCDGLQATRGRVSIRTAVSGTRYKIHGSSLMTSSHTYQVPAPVDARPPRDTS